MKYQFTFFAPGIPKPAGSKTSFPHSKTGRMVTLDSSGAAGKNWRQTVQVFAKETWEGPPLECPIITEMRFVMPRPKSHYRTGKYAGELRADAPTWHTKKPDKTKLERSVEDALTGIIWKDDCQIYSGRQSKAYGSMPGVMVEVHWGSAADDF
jgi:Holliday junction resolvase RusA-like endonuclease